MQPEQRVIEVCGTNVRGIEEALQAESAQGWQYVKAEPFYMLGRAARAGKAYHTRRYLLLLGRDEQKVACCRVEYLRLDAIPARRTVADEINGKLERMALCGFELLDLLPMLAFSSDPEYPVHPTGGYILVWAIRASVEIAANIAERATAVSAALDRQVLEGLVSESIWAATPEAQQARDEALRTAVTEITRVDDELMPPDIQQDLRGALPDRDRIVSAVSETLALPHTMSETEKLVTDVLFRLEGYLLTADE